MKALEFYSKLEEKQEFTELTNTGINTNYKNVFDFAERYAQQRVNEVLDKAAEQAQMIMHDGHHKTNSYVKHVQVGANNVQIDKESILKLKNNEK